MILVLPCLAFCGFLCFDSCPCFPGFTLSLALWTLFASRLDYCCLPGLSLFALPLLDIVCRSSTHASPKDYSVSCPCPTCLLFIDPACIKTMFWNKASQMDPHVSRLCHSVTEYSAPRGSSGFSNGPWSGMDPFNQLLDLRQGSLSIEEYVTQFCVLSDKVPFDEVALKNIFRFGLSKPVKSWLPEGKFNVSLKDFMDYALRWLFVYCGCRGRGT